MNKRAPITIKFEIPYFTVSGIQVRYLKVVEKSGYQALPWVRYITQNGDDYRQVSGVLCPFGFLASLVLTTRPVYVPHTRSTTLRWLLFDYPHVLEMLVYDIIIYHDIEWLLGLDDRFASGACTMYIKLCWK